MRLTFGTCKPLFSRGLRGVPSLTLCGTLGVNQSDKGRTVEVGVLLLDQLATAHRNLLGAKRLTSLALDLHENMTTAQSRINIINTMGTMMSRGPSEISPGLSMPQLGQLSALLLTCSPHSRHGLNAIYSAVTSCVYHAASVPDRRRDPIPNWLRGRGCRRPSVFRPQGLPPHTANGINPRRDFLRCRLRLLAGLPIYAFGDFAGQRFDIASGECQGSCRLNSVMIPPIDDAAVLAA